MDGVGNHDGGGSELPVDEARDFIADYFNHIQDDDYVASVFDRLGSPVVSATLEGMIRRGGRAGMTDAWLFVQDVILRRSAPKEFRRAYPRSALLAAIRDQLYAPDYQIRHLAISLLGKLGPRSNARFLASALPWYLAHDPLNVWNLLDELLWLRRRSRRVAMRKTLLESLVRAPLFVTRWAAVEILWNREVERFGWRGWGRREDAWVRQFLRRLAQDEHPRVRVEARWRLRQLRSRALPTVRRRRRRQHAEERRPAADFPSYFEVSLNVGNYLGVTGTPDYDATLVEAIARHLATHPITAGYDIDAYWAQFVASRREP